MTNVTPQQMRELTSKQIRQEDVFAHILELHSALRTAADQLEAVQATLAAIHAVEWVELPIEADSWIRWGEQVDAILNADLGADAP